MDIRIKLSLAGGHSWDFVCDEDDPTVSGIVSALPGANVDAALPPDGLIQVESRSGERLFLTRTSLVAVAIQRLSPPETEGGDARRRLRPTDFVRLPDLLSAQAIDEILQPDATAVAQGAAPGEATELQLATLPTSLVELLISIAAQAASDLDLEVEGPSHLDVRLFGAGASASFALPGSSPEQILTLAVPLSDPITFCVPDLTLSRHGLQADESRTIGLAAGEGLALAFSAAVPTITSATDRPAIILVTSLCRGEARAS